MTRKDIIRMARKAGSLIETAQEKDLLWLEDFANRVAERERDACAKVCEKLQKDMTPIASLSAYACSIMIRARGRA
jgi:hypothetical protein